MRVFATHIGLVSRTLQLPAINPKRRSVKAEGLKPDDEEGAE